MQLLIILTSLAALCSAQYPTDGRYYPDNSGAYHPTGDEGRYYPDNSGAYQGDDSGRYNADNSGAYANGFDASASSLQQVQAPPAPPPAQYKNTPEIDGRWRILHQLSDIDTEGGYHWEYETENKIIAEESGKVHNAGTDAEALRAKGNFQYTGPDDKVYSVVYTADENGFNPQADHLPTPPPIPAAIVKSLNYLKATNQL